MAGFKATEVISFENLIVSAKILLVDHEKDHESLFVDGIIGLGNYKKEPNIFDLGLKSQQLLSSKFAFSLGLSDLQ